MCLFTGRMLSTRCPSGELKKKMYVLSQEVNEDKNGHALKYTSCMYRVQAWNHGENDFSRIKFNKNVIKPELQ